MSKKKSQKSQLKKKEVPQKKKTPFRKTAKQPQKNWILIVVIALIAIVALVGIISILLSNSQVEIGENEISVHQAYEKYQQGIFILDVRTQEEWEEVHIPNTTLIPLDELEARMDELPQGQEIVIICRSGNRSAEALDLLLQAGFENVTSVAGGIKEWRKAEYPVFSGS